MARVQVLVVEDDRVLRRLLTVKFEKRGFVVGEAGTAEAALKMVEENVWDVVLLDYMLPDKNGLQILERLSELDPDLPTIFMTAHSSVDNAVSAMKGGAYDYLVKPVNPDAVIPKIEKAIELTSLRRDLRRIQVDLKRRYGYSSIVGLSEPMEHVLSMVKTVAASEAETILLLGESGVGKNLIAQAVHYNSRRANHPFMTITCTALPENLLESELFGHQKGAFTDARQTKKGLCELADGGTVFLDEIGDMPLGLQAKLLRFLEERTFRRIGGTSDLNVDVRVIAATNKDLKRAMLEKTFREDLYYRLNVIGVRVPPLRERRSDIPLLATHFVKSFNKKLRRNVLGIEPEALAAMGQYDWPGNVRELRNMMERAMILCQRDYLGLEDFPSEIGGASGAMDASGNPESAPTDPLDANGSAEDNFRLPQSGIRLDEHEKDLISQAMEMTHGNQSRAADLLGISRNQLIYRLKKFQLV